MESAWAGQEGSDTVTWPRLIQQEHVTRREKEDWGTFVILYRSKVKENYGKEAINT